MNIHMWGHKDVFLKDRQAYIVSKTSRALIFFDQSNICSLAKVKIRLLGPFTKLLDSFGLKSINKTKYFLEKYLKYFPSDFKSKGDNFQILNKRQIQPLLVFTHYVIFIYLCQGFTVLAEELRNLRGQGNVV